LNQIIILQDNGLILYLTRLKKNRIVVAYKLKICENS